MLMKNPIPARITYCLACLVLPAQIVTATTTNVTTSGFTFVPSVITIHAGDTVIWNNLGGIHSVTGEDPTEPLCGSDFPASCTNTFYVPGSYAYHCIPHQSFGMTGLVQVLPPPAVPAVLGDPEVLPDGRLQFTVTSAAYRTNVIQASTNAANPIAWESIATTIPTNTQFLFIDSNATSFPLRFYRVAEP